jgi:hypothetical protein
MKPSELKLLESVYNFMGANEILLQKEFSKIPEVEKNFSYPQFCLTIYSNLNENSTTTKSTK